MAVHSVTKTGVLKAIAEYDRLGKEAFLGRYGYGAAQQYFLSHMKDYGEV